MKKHLLMLFFATLQSLLFSQFWGDSQNFFDGADTIRYNAIEIRLDSSVNNIWQIGSPQKTIFSSANTAPNALVTDTLNFYPINNISRFSINPLGVTDWQGGGVGAIRWVQKLDFDSLYDGAMLEFSIDSGTTWQNAFNNPYVYNFYGFDLANVDTLATGEVVFSGTDSTWKDIWLCFDINWAYDKNLKIRFSMLSDSIDNQKEGWLIDNLHVRPTLLHTASKKEQENYVRLFPNPANDILNIELARFSGYHIIEEMDLINQWGQIVESWKNIPTKFFIQTHNYADGVYFLRVKSNLKTKIIPFLIHKI
jgi:Secretion system C-terminal sorting domain